MSDRHREGISDRAALLVVGAGASSIALFLTFFIGQAPAPVRTVNWLVLALLFAAAEILVLTVELRQRALVLTLSALPFAIGLFMASPESLLTARLAGGAFALLLVLRLKPSVAFLNLSAQWLETSVALVMFGALHLDRRAPPSDWPDLIAINLTRNLVGFAVVFAALRLTSRQSTTQLSVGAAFAAITALVDTSFGILAVTLLLHEAWGLVPLAVVLTLLLSAYKAYERLIRQNRERDLLHAFSASLATAVVEDNVLPTLLEQATELLHAERAALVLRGPTGLVMADTTDPHHLTPLEPTDPAARVHERAIEHMPGTWHLDRTVDAHLIDALGATEIIAASFRIEHEDIATVIVLDRRGDVRQFEPEDERLLATLAAHSGVSVQNGALVERLREEARIKEHMSLHDALTGLANRTMFREVLEAELGTGEPVAVLLLDIDNFKDVNDTLGHQRGDELLMIIGERLSTTIGPDHLVARLGGDEFAVMVRGAGLTGAFNVGHAIVDSLRQSIMLANLPIDVATSIGVALAPDHSVDATTLLRFADISLYIAKDNLTGIEVYDPERDDTSTDRLALMGELRSAIAERSLEVYFQPQLDLVTNRVIGTEALVRWLHPRHGWIPPDRFIAIAERTGVIQDLTRLVLEKSLDENAAWRRAGHDLVVSVNLSPRDLLVPGLVEDVSRMLRDRHLPAESLCLELTETAIMGDRLRSVGVMRRLRALGVGIAIDDFGQGQSSLAYLSQLPISSAKIDRDFVRTFTAESEVIVRSVVMMGESFGFKVVAEGIETGATADRLVELNCRYGQGYHFARPLPPFEFAAWLDRWILEHAATV